MTQVTRASPMFAVHILQVIFSLTIILSATAQTSVTPYPRVAVGTFNLKFADGDPSWTKGSMVLDTPSPTSGSSSTLSTWSGENPTGSPYTDGPFSIVAQSCAVSGASVSVILRVTKAGNFRQCNYQTYSKDANGKTVLNALTAKSNDFTYPTGDCPSTYEAAKQDGISWMNPNPDFDNTTWQCDADCQPLDCKEYGTTTATTSPASLQTETFPRVAVGTFTLVSSSDANWLSGMSVIDPPSPTSSSSATVSKASGERSDSGSYDLGGYALVAQSCVVSGGGSVSIIFRAEVAPTVRQCQYTTASKDDSGKTISVTLLIQDMKTDGTPFEYPMGDCPSTYEAAMQDGISWMSSTPYYINSTSQCDENCQPLDCKEYGTTTATTSPAALQTVTFPRVAVGNFTLVSATTASWTDGTYVQDAPSPTSSSISTVSDERGVWDGSPYVNGVYDMVAQSCVVSDGGSVSIILRAEKTGDNAFRTCLYQTYSKDASGKTKMLSSDVYDEASPWQYPMGDCPSTYEAAKQNGISWMNPNPDFYSSTWSCDADCQPLDCKEYGTTTATTSPAALQTVTFPRVAVGTFTLVSSSDANWLSGMSVIDPPSPTSSSSATVSKASGVNYDGSYDLSGYALVAQSCVVSGGGSVSIIYRTEVAPTVRQCHYSTASKDDSGKTISVTLVVHDQTDGTPFEYPMGDCPSTYEAAKQDGISWMSSTPYYINSTWQCDENCQPLDCKEYGTTTATTSPAALQTVTFPRVAVGNFTLVSATTASWTDGTYVQDAPSPTSSSISTVSDERGVWDGSPYVTGVYDMVAQSCVVSDGGSVSIILRAEKTGDNAFRTCLYQTYSKDASGKTKMLSSDVYDEASPWQYPMGDCPATYEAAKQNGISWMNPNPDFYSSTWSCDENCQPLDCKEYGTTTATTSPAALQTVTFPRVAVGTFTLVSSSDTNWLSGMSVIDPPSPTSSSSATVSKASGVNYDGSYDLGGYALIAQSCVVSGGGSVSIIYRTEVAPTVRQCHYSTASKDDSGKTISVTLVVHDQTDGTPFEYPMGDCPSTYEAAKQDGISWMSSTPYYINSTWQCDENCQPLDCKEYGTAPSPSPPPPPPPPPEFRPWVVRFSIQLVGYTISELEPLRDTYLTYGISTALYLSIHNATIDVISMEGASGSTLRRSLLQEQPKVVVNFSISVASEEQARAIKALLLSLSMPDLMQVLMMNGLAKLEPSPSLTSEPIVFNDSSNLPITVIYEGLFCGSTPCPSSQVILNVAERNAVKVRIRFSDGACSGLETILKEKITVPGPAFIEGEVDPQGGASYDVNIRANTGEVGNVTMTVASGVCTLGKRSSKKSMVLPGGTLQVDTERPTAQVGVLTPFSNKVNSTLTMRIVMPRDSKGSLQASSFDVVNGNVSTVTEENKSVLEGERAFLISVIPTITEGIVNVSLLQDSFTDSVGNGNKGVVRVIGGAADSKAQEVLMVPFLHDAVQPEASVSVHGDGYNTEEGLALFKLSFSEPVIGFGPSSINVTNGVLSNFVTLEGIEDPTQNTSSTVMDDLPYILATEIGLLVTPSSLKGDTNVTVSVIDGGFQDLSGNTGSALLRSAFVTYRGIPEEEEAAEGVGMAATGTASVAIATGAVATASLSVASTVAAATVSSVAVTGVSASVAAAEGSALCNAASSMSTSNMVGMLRALRTMQFYSMTKSFGGGENIPEAYRSFASQLDWVTLQFGSSWFVSSSPSDGGKSKKANAQVAAQRRRRRALLLASGPTRRQSRGDGSVKSPTTNAKDKSKDAAEENKKKVEKMKKDVKSVVSVSMNVSAIANISSWLNSGDTVAAKSYWNGVVNPPTNDIEAFGQSALIGIALLAGASLIRFASERVYHVFSSSSDETPSTLVFPYVELTALNLIAPGVALSAGKLVGAKSAGIAEIVVGIAAFLVLPAFLALCALRVINGMVLKNRYAKYELEGGAGASMMLAWKSLGKRKGMLKALMQTRRMLVKRRAGRYKSMGAAEEVTWAEAAAVLSESKHAAAGTSHDDEKNKPPTTRDDGSSSFSSKIVEKTMKFSKSMNKYVEKKGEWVVNDDSGAIPTFVDVYGMFFSDYRGELPGERDFDPSGAEHFPGYPNGGLLASIRKLQFSAMGGYLRGYHYRIGYGAFVAFKTFIFPFFFGVVGKSSMANLYMTLVVTFVDFMWVTVWRPADDFLKHGVAQLDTLSQVLTTAAALTASGFQDSDSTILWVMIVAASSGIFSVMLANLDSLRDGKDVLISIWDWARGRKTTPIDEEEDDVVENT